MGHMLAWRWDTAARWMMMRARRNAQALGQVLYLAQAADASSPPLPVDISAKRMNQVNPGATGDMRGTRPAHLGTRAHLLEHVGLLVARACERRQKAVARAAVHPRDTKEVQQAQAGLCPEH